MIKIEKNVPIPAYSVGRPIKYPFGQLAVAESLFVPNVNRKLISNALSAYHRKHSEKRFTARTVEGGVRVWRLI